MCSARESVRGRDSKPARPACRLRGDRVATASQLCSRTALERGRWPGRAAAFRTSQNADHDCHRRSGSRRCEGGRDRPTLMERTRRLRRAHGAGHRAERPCLRVSSRAYWDMGPPRPSGIEISVKAYAPGGIRRSGATRREGHAVAGTTRFHRRLRRRHLGGHSRTLAQPTELSLVITERVRQMRKRPHPNPQRLLRVARDPLRVLDERNPD